MRRHSYKRTAPCPPRPTISLYIKKDEFPELAEWLWTHPFNAQGIIREALNRSLKAGVLANIEQELNNGNAEA